MQPVGPVRTAGKGGGEGAGGGEAWGEAGEQGTASLFVLCRPPPPLSAAPEEEGEAV